MKPRMQELLFLLLLVGGLTAAYFGVFRRADAQRVSLRQDTLAKQRALANLDAATAGVDNLNRQITALAKDIAFFDSRLPQEREMDKILDELARLAEANSLSTKSIKTLKSERNANYSEQPIQLNVTGDFNGFYAFLLQLEKLPRVTRVTQMNLQKNQTRDGDLNAMMTLIIYFAPNTASPAAGGGGGMMSAALAQ